MDNNYFINCKDENIKSFANALLYQMNDEQSASESAKDVVRRLCGDTSVEQVWENKNWVAMLSTDSCIKVLNVFSKKDERELQSIEVD